MKIKMPRFDGNWVKAVKSTSKLLLDANHAEMLHRLSRETTDARSYEEVRKLCIAALEAAGYEIDYGPMARKGG